MTTTLARPGGRTRADRSTVAQKQLMALSGIVLLGFIVAHMVGNLKFFFGPDSFDHYSHWLRTILEPVLPHVGFLWLLRAALAVAVVTHVYTAVNLALKSRAARPVRYARTSNVQATYASRTMRWGGVIILLFVIFHLLDLTIGTVNPNGVHGEVFANVIATFERVPVAVFYILANAALCLHLYHGVWSMLQTLGVNQPKYDAGLRGVSKLFAVVIFLGFISVPIAVLAGFRG